MITVFLCESISESLELLSKNVVTEVKLVYKYL